MHLSHTIVTMASAVAVDNKLTISEKVSAFIAFHAIFIPPSSLILTIIFAPAWIKVQAILLYIVFVVWSGCSFGCEYKHGNPNRRFAEDFPVFHTMRNYLKLSFGPLPKELVDAEKKDGAQFIFAAFPHGCSSEFRILMEGLLHDVLPNIHHKVRALAATVLFCIPIVREIAISTGCVNASRKTAETNLDKGHSLVVLPGGEAEQLMTEYGKEKVYLKRRKGFIKLALRKRVPVVPMFVFGSSDLFHTSKFLYGPRYWLMKNLGVCIPLCRGSLGSPVCPLPNKVTI